MTSTVLGARADDVVHRFDISFVERLQQNEQAQRTSAVQQGLNSRSRQHSKDDQNAACPCDSCLNDLVGIHQEIFAHSRHVQGRERVCGGLEVGHGAVETAWLG